MSDRVTTLIEGGIIEEGVPLGPLTTYKSGGPARYFARIEDEDGLRALARSRLGEEMELLVLGRGSNLLVADRGFDGLVVRLGTGFSWITVEGTGVRAGAGTPLAHVARETAASGLRGLEFLVGIPGSVGGAVRQNAGCLGSETKDRLLWARVIDLGDGSSEELGPEQLELSYRHSNLTPTQVVTRAAFRGDHGDPSEAAEEIRRVTRWRRQHQPGGSFNAGSVFKNPPGAATAGEIIDRLGLKGLRIGGVSVSTKHANFFVAEPGATSAEIRALILEVKDRVFRATGTMLEPEIQMVGFPE